MAITFHEPLPGQRSRAFDVRGIPDFDKRGEQGGVLRVIIYYDGQSNADKGIALDHHVMPLLKAAPDLLAAAAALLSVWDAFDEADGPVPLDEQMEALRAAAAKARGEG